MRPSPSRAGTTIVIDGKLSEEIWDQAPPINEFVQRDPAEGEAPSQHTDARIVYDETRAVRRRARARFGTPSHRWPADASRPTIAVGLDSGSWSSYFDRRSAYEFGVNPVGREGRPLLLQRWRQRRQLGRRVGCAGGARRRRMERGVPHSVFSAALQKPRWWSRGFRRDARGRASGGDVELAAALTQRQWVCLSVRRGHRPADGRDAEEAGAAAVHARQRGAECRERQSARGADRSSRRRWVSI